MTAAAELRTHLGECTGSLTAATGFHLAQKNSSPETRWVPTLESVRLSWEKIRIGRATQKDVTSGEVSIQASRRHQRFILYHQKNDEVGRVENTAAPGL